VNTLDSSLHRTLGGHRHPVFSRLATKRRSLPKRKSPNHRKIGSNGV